MVDGKTCRVETDTGPQVVRAEHVVLATGSVPAALPNLPFGGKVISSTEALSLASGARAAGRGRRRLYRARARHRLSPSSASKVTVVEAQDRILPAYDAELVRPVARRLQALGVEVLTSTRAAGLSDDGRCAAGRRVGVAQHRRRQDPRRHRPARPRSTASAWSGSTSP